METCIGHEHLAAAQLVLEIRLTSSLETKSAATNADTGEGVAVKKVTNVFSKKILAKRALREIKLLQHFRGMRHPSFAMAGRVPWLARATGMRHEHWRLTSP